jgi:hypothetical protein
MRAQTVSEFCLSRSSSGSRGVTLSCALLLLIFQSGCAFIPDSALDSFGSSYPEVATALPDEVTVALDSLVGLGRVDADHATTLYPAGLYAVVSSSPTAVSFVPVPLAASGADDVSLTGFYETPNAYIAEVSGLYSNSADPGAACNLVVIRKEDGKFFCVDFTLQLGSSDALPRPLLVNSAGTGLYFGGYWTDEHRAVLASVGIPVAAVADESGTVEAESTVLEIEPVYSSLGEFVLNSESDVLYSGVLESTPTMRVVQAGGTVSSLAVESGYCLSVGSDTDSGNFYWYTGEIGSLTLKKATRDSLTGAFTVSSPSVTLPVGDTGVFTPAAFSGSGEMEACTAVQVFSTENASYIIGTYATTSPSVAESTRLLQVTLSGVAVKSALSTVGIDTIAGGKTAGSQVFLNVTHADETSGLVVLTDSTPSSITEAEWIAGGTYQFVAWRPSSDGKFYFSGTTASASVFAIQETAGGGVTLLSSEAPVFSDFGLQPPASP